MSGRQTGGPAVCGLGIGAAGMGVDWAGVGVATAVGALVAAAITSVGAGVAEGRTAARGPYAAVTVIATAATTVTSTAIPAAARRGRRDIDRENARFKASSLVSSPS